MEMLLASDDGLVGMCFSFQGMRNGETTGGRGLLFAAFSLTSYLYLLGGIGWVGS